jgi:hypothetical protein
MHDVMALLARTAFLSRMIFWQLNSMSTSDGALGVSTWQRRMHLVLHRSTSNTYSRRVRYRWEYDDSIRNTHSPLFFSASSTSTTLGLTASFLLVRRFSRFEPITRRQVFQVGRNFGECHCRTIAVEMRSYTLNSVDASLRVVAASQVVAFRKQYQHSGLFWENLCFCCGSFGIQTSIFRIISDAGHPPKAVFREENILDFMENSWAVSWNLFSA